MPDDAEQDKPRRGRKPTGKRSDPAYKAYAFYLPNEVMDAVKVAIIQRHYAGDASDLTEELLRQWLAEITPSQ